jgi:L-alanine-DL-glutamate epimerase-like enolase superfamily enzyme
MRVEQLEVAAFVIPTQSPEADGTFAWDATTWIVVNVRSGGEVGLGYTYNTRAAAELVSEALADVVLGRCVLDVEGAWVAMRRAVRNIGRDGVAASAIAAVDVALWDLKARLLRLPLAALLGRVREEIPVYGSGGFVTYGAPRLRRQIERWEERGIGAMKIKLAGDLGWDTAWVREARSATDARLMVDANGAYARKSALAAARRFHELGVTYFEEPVSSDDLEGLRLLRDGAPLEIAAGEYGYDALYFRRMLDAGAVDVLQADATRCAGISGFRRAAALAESFGVPLSAHTAPSLHAHLGVTTTVMREVEYFHDHARIEEWFLDGALVPRGGALRPDMRGGGMGLTLRRADLERYCTYEAAHRPSRAQSEQGRRYAAGTRDTEQRLGD